MIKDLYTRTPSDPLYNGSIETSDTYEKIITKIKMILGTQPGKVLGDSAFGIGIEDLVFSTSVNTFRLESMINSQIQTYVSESSEYKIATSVSFGRGQYYDYCVIDIIINDEKVAGVMVS